MTKSKDELRKMAAKRLASRLVRDHLRPGNPSKRSKAKPEKEAELSVCVVHGRQTARKVVSKALEARLEKPVHRYGSCEDALRYTEHYDTFVVYNNFGKRMNGARGVTQIRALKPDAFILGVTSVPGFRQKFLAAGADDTVLLSGNEVAELAERIEKRQAEVGQGTRRGER